MQFLWPVLSTFWGPRPHAGDTFFGPKAPADGVEEAFVHGHNALMPLDQSGQMAAVAGVSLKQSMMRDQAVLRGAQAQLEAVVEHVFGRAAQKPRRS